MIPKNLKKYVTLEAFLLFSTDVEFILGQKKSRKFDEQVFQKERKIVKAQVAGGFCGGVEAKVVTPLTRAALNGKLKSELELWGGINSAYELSGQINLKPLIFTLDGDITIPGSETLPDVKLFQVNYIQNLTNELPIYPRPK